MGLQWMAFILIFVLCISAHELEDEDPLIPQGSAMFIGSDSEVYEGTEESDETLTATLKRQYTKKCSAILCVTKDDAGTSAREYRAHYTGSGSILLFWKFKEAEAGVKLSAPQSVYRGSKGEAYVFVILSDEARDAVILTAEVTSAPGQPWKIPSYTWTFASLFNRLCLDTGDVCLEEVISPDRRTRTVLAVNSQYIEQSIFVNVSASQNTHFELWDNNDFDSTAMFVVPQRIPGQEARRVHVFTATQNVASEGWWFSFEFYGRKGDYRAKWDNYYYDLPFVGKQRLNQGFGGIFSHTGWSQFADDWGLEEGTAVYSARDGVVAGVKMDQLYSKFDEGVCPVPVSKDCATAGSDANYVLIRHADATWSMYAHLKPAGAVVKPGDIIKGKTLLGYSGNTGYSNGPHLHFQVAKASVFGHPEEWISETVYVEFVTNYQTEPFAPIEGQVYSSDEAYPDTGATVKAITTEPHIIQAEFPPNASPSDFSSVSHKVIPSISGAPTMSTCMSILSFFLFVFCLLVAL